MMIIRLGDKIINKTVAEYLLQNMYRYIIINVTPIIKVTPFDGIYKKFLLPRRLNPVSYTHLTLPTNREV